MALRGVRGGSVRVEGLSQLIRDFNRMNKQLGTDLRRELVDIGKIVADEAKNEQMPSQELAGGQSGEDNVRNSGRLQSSIRPRMRGTATIVEQRRDGSYSKFPYGAIYEYSKGRPFLEPALDARTEDVVQALDDMLDRLSSANGFGRGGIL
jgi:hypothetical protein